MPLMSEVKKTGKRGGKVGTFLSWTLAVLACLWVAWCCAIGPSYWFGGGLSDFGWLNVLYLAVAFAICFFDCRRAGQIRTWPSRASAIFRTSV